MGLSILDKSLWFPPVSEALADGLLAIGGDLSTNRLLLAYKNGIFPWFTGDIPMWWSPDPRFVLFPNELIVSKSMKSVIKKREFLFTADTAFDKVINACKETERKDQDGTWITDAVEEAYTKLFNKGIAHSAEAWYEDRLVGGLYGVRINNVFFGESMFSHKSNASKFAFISYVHMLAKQGVQIIDCQVYTEHLESLGARMITREDFLSYLK